MTDHPPPYGPSQPYGAPSPYGGQGGYSDKSKVVSGLLQILLPFVGICGVGRLYTGHITIGLIQLLVFLIGFPLIFVLIGFLILPAIWLWTVIDGIVILTSESRDANGLLLRS